MQEEEEEEEGIVGMVYPFFLYSSKFLSSSIHIPSLHPSILSSACPSLISPPPPPILLSSNLSIGPVGVRVPEPSRWDLLTNRYITVIDSVGPQSV